MTRLRSVLGRVLFAALSAAVLLVFSEKLYWYVTGYSVLDLLCGYFFPAFVLLWLVDAFRVRRPAAVFLAGAVFGFVAEGMLTNTLYAGGPLALFSASYTPLAWHAPLSVVFGWWWLRRELVAGRGRWLALGCAVVGGLWGLWALAWWLPENAADAALLAQGARLGRWPVADFALHAATFTALLALAHWLLGRGTEGSRFQVLGSREEGSSQEGSRFQVLGSREEMSSLEPGTWPLEPSSLEPFWRPAFRPSRVEGALVAGGLLVFFVAQVLPVYPWAPLRLLALVGASLAVLAINRRREPPGSALGDLAGPVAARRLLPLALMPAAAVAVYALAAALNPSPNLIRAITAYGLVLGTAVLGGLAWLLAALVVVRQKKNLPPSGMT